jgi:hypothetical protein
MTSRISSPSDLEMMTRKISQKYLFFEKHLLTKEELAV